MAGNHCNYYSFRVLLMADGTLEMEVSMFSDNYAYFLKIVEVGNLSKAADSLYVSQSALTKYLQRIEASFGTELFNRKERPLRLTYAGQLFYEYIQAEETIKQNLIDRIGEITSQGREKICIGMPLWRSCVLLPGFLKSFMLRHPLISIELSEGSAKHLEKCLMEDTVDFILANLPLNYGNVSFDPLFTEKILLVGSQNDLFLQDLIKKKTSVGHYYHADIEEFKDGTFIMAQKSQHITTFVENMLKQHRINLNTTIRTSNVTLAVNMASAGLGYTFIPECGINSEFFPKDSVYLFSLNNPLLTCVFAAAYKKDQPLSPACQIFISEFRQYCLKMLDVPLTSSGMHLE